MSDARRDLLTDAARALFFTRGYSQTKVLDVATEAGFSKRTVYLEFGSKDELFATICIEGMRLLRDGLQAVLDQRLAVMAELQGLAGAYLEFYQHRSDHFRLLFVVANDEILGRFAPGQLEQLGALEAACVGSIARAIDRARAEGLVDAELDSWQHAVGTWGALTGVLLLGSNGRRMELARAPLETLYWQTFETLLRGAAG